MGLSTTTQYRFFMTRQIANVLEDLDRQILSSASISLLYGQNGVGKSRLLRQFVSTRKQHRPVVLIHFSSDGNYYTDDRCFSQLEFEENVLQSLKQHSVLILDQFENVESNLQRRILSFWTALDDDADMNLVLSGNQQLVASLSPLSAHLNCIIKSVELKPLDEKDREAYLAAKICGAFARDPKFPRHIKKLIRQTKGLYEELDKLCQQYSERIECDDKTYRSQGKFNFAFATLTVAVTLLLIVTANNTLYQGRSTEQQLGKQPLQSIQADSVVLKDKPLTSRAQSSLNSMSRNSQILTLLQRRLKATEHWLAAADDSAASIQIMTLVVKPGADTSLNKYLDRLKATGIDLDKIFIYRADSANAQIYGVLYGTYATRQQASQQLNSLPDILSADKPIPRSILAIKQEMEKHELI